MILRWLIASIHLLGLVIGVAAVLNRGRAFKRVSDVASLPPVFVADNWWGISGMLLLGTGLWRAFGGLEKGTDYYLQHPLFHLKLGLFALVLLLEILPMITLIRWRRALRQSSDIDLSRAPLFSRTSFVQCSMVVIIVFLAAAIARGVGF